jgi:uncharacterized protein YdeI (YjbR/CyaY-like superfamily)
MEIGKTLYVSEREEWRTWLANNYDKEKEIWLVSPHKDTGEPRLLYNDAVEEALCFGWIDSTVKKLDEGHSVQRFSPRRPNSGYSQQNIERLRWLAEQGMLLPTIKETVKPVIEKEFEFPQDILDAIKANKEAWKNYQAFSPAYQRIRIAYIEGARGRPEEFNKRLANFIKKTEQNKQIGFGGIEKFY